MTPTNLARPTRAAHSTGTLTEADLPARGVDAPSHGIQTDRSPCAPTALLVAGTWVSVADGRTFIVEDPATGGLIAAVAEAGPTDCKAALDATAPAWAASPTDERAHVLQRGAALAHEGAGDRARRPTAEMGKPLCQSAGEVEFAAAYLDWFADQASRIEGRICTSPNGRARHLVTPEPVGPLVTPYLTMPAEGGVL